MHWVRPGGIRLNWFLTRDHQIPMILLGINPKLEPPQGFVNPLSAAALIFAAAELFSMQHHLAVLPLDGCQKNWPEFIKFIDIF